MIIKGTSVKSRRHASYLANHLLNANENEICEVWDIDGHAKPNDLKAAVVDFYDMVQLTRGGKNGLFMLAINPEIGESMSKEQYFQSISEAEKRFGLVGQPKAIVRHFKEGRDHIHVVWQTTDTDTRKIKPDIYFYKRKCMRLARDLEIELGHKPVSNEKSIKSYSDKEREIAKIDSTQLKPDKRKLFIQSAFKDSKDSVEFTKKMNDFGLTPAKGKVGICLVDKAGQSYNLAKEMKKKVSQEQLDAFFKVQYKKLPEVEALINPISKRESKRKQTKKIVSTENPIAEKKAIYITYDFENEKFFKKQSQAEKNIPDFEKQKQDIILRSEEFRRKRTLKKNQAGFEI